MPSLLDMILRRSADESAIPRCPNHKTDMMLRGKMGRPSRFAAMSEEDYTLIYYCPFEGCNETAERQVTRRQIPVQGIPPERPDFSRKRDPRP